MMRCRSPHSGKDQAAEARAPAEKAYHLAYRTVRRLFPYYQLSFHLDIDMQHLPAGWRVSNSSGDYSTPSNRVDDGDDDLEGDEGLEAEDLRPDSPGWEDMEDDVEELSLKCLLCDRKLNAVRAMVDHCKQEHAFNLDELRKMHGVWQRFLSPLADLQLTYEQTPTFSAPSN